MLLGVSLLEPLMFMETRYVLSTACSRGLYLQPTSVENNCLLGSFWKLWVRVQVKTMLNNLANDWIDQVKEMTDRDDLIHR